MNTPMKCPACGRVEKPDYEDFDIVGCIMCGEEFCTECGSAPEGICYDCGKKMSEES